MTWFGRKEIAVCPGAGWDVDTEMVDMDVDMEMWIWSFCSFQHPYLKKVLERTKALRINLEDRAQGLGREGCRCQEAHNSG